MRTVVDTPAPDRRKPLGLLSGSIIAACLALVFGACLLTILDAMRRPQPTASAALISTQAATKVIPASF
jgi:acyl-coenzyme A thioesterase PaaI-like protein